MVEKTFNQSCDTDFEAKNRVFETDDMADGKAKIAPGRPKRRPYGRVRPSTRYPVRAANERQ